MLTSSRTDTSIRHPRNRGARRTGRPWRPRRRRCTAPTCRSSCAGTRCSGLDADELAHLFRMIRRRRKSTLLSHMSHSHQAALPCLMPFSPLARAPRVADACSIPSGSAPSPLALYLSGLCSSSPLAHNPSFIGACSPLPRLMIHTASLLAPLRSCPCS